jgi:hypothetical protein
MKPIDVVGKYVYNNLINLDQTLNTITGGDPDETVSSRLGRLEKKYNGNIPWYRPWAKVISFALDHIQKNHCTQSIEGTEENIGKNGIVDQP